MKEILELYEENRWLGIERALQAVYDAGVAAGRSGVAPAVARMDVEMSDVVGQEFLNKFTRVT